MGEIECDRSSMSVNGVADAAEKKTVQITLKSVGPSPPSRLSIPSPIKVHDLRKMIAVNADLPTEKLSLIWRGNVLHDDDNGGNLLLQLNDGDSLIVAVKPNPPPKHIRDGLGEDDDEDDLKFQLPQSTSWWKKRLFLILRNKLKLPDMVLMAIFSLTVKMWAVIILWFVLAPVAHRWEIGPLYILGTGFAIIFYNLGQRRPGDASAYSIFNEGFRELPGTLNADRLDRDIRAGQF